jgi:hypothetical protein
MSGYGDGTLSTPTLSASAIGKARQVALAAQPNRPSASAQQRVATSQAALDGRMDAIRLLIDAWLERKKALDQSEHSVPTKRSKTCGSSNGSGMSAAAESFHQVVQIANKAASLYADSVQKMTT